MAGPGCMLGRKTVLPRLPYGSHNVKKYLGAAVIRYVEPPTPMHRLRCRGHELAMVLLRN